MALSRFVVRFTTSPQPYHHQLIRGYGPKDLDGHPSGANSNPSLAPDKATGGTAFSIGSASRPHAGRFSEVSSMKHSVLSAFAAGVLAAALVLLAACSSPVGPGLPSGATAGEARTVPTGTASFVPTEKTTGLVRNPGMGWVLYCDAFANMVSNRNPDYTKGVFHPDLFWQAFDACGASAQASIFYLRAPWSYYEPTKGQYAWNTDPTYQALIQGALDRGLKLAFRVYVDSQDSWRQATPDYVRLAGAKGYTNNGWDATGASVPFWTPYSNDAVFLAQFQAFIAAFGQKYNDPAVVDFIDAMGLGWWGECHHVFFDTAQPKADLTSTMNAVASAYRAAFPRVLLGAQQGGDAISYSDALVKSRTYGVLRRDSIGMTQWFTPADKAYYADMVVNQGVPHFAENGWNGFGNGYFQTYMNNNGNPFSTIRDMLVYCLADAKAARANTFDLRVPGDAIEWMKNPDLVDDFVVNGGYRLVPTGFTYPLGIGSTRQVTVESTWKNAGLGIVPNRRPEWNGKYRVAYALIPGSSAVPAQTVVTNIDPAAWLKGATYRYSSRLSFGNVDDGVYTLAYAIVDTTRANTPGLNLAVTNSALSSGWNALGTTTVAGLATTAPREQTSNLTPLATLSSSWGTGSATLATLADGEVTRAWGSSQGIAFPGYLTLDFGPAPVTADGLTLVTHYGQGQGITNFDVEAWFGSAWVPVATNQTVGWNSATDSEEYRFVPFPATSASKFRLKVNAANTQWNLVAVNELPWWGSRNPAPANVAPGASVTSTMGTGAGALSSLVDGNPTAAWGSVIGQALPGTLTLDLGAGEVTTGRITLATWYGLGQGVTNLDVEWYNGTSWVPAVTNKALTWSLNTNTVEYRDVVFPEVTTSKLRVRVNSSNRQWNATAINELQIWGY